MFLGTNPGPSTVGYGGVSIRKGVHFHFQKFTYFFILLFLLYDLPNQTFLNGLVMIGNWEEERSLLTLFIKSLLPNYDRLKTFEQGKHLRFVPWAPPRLEPGQFI